MYILLLTLWTILFSCHSSFAYTDTIIIDVPGHYLYGGPLSGDPRINNIPMIRITASNVTLDLGGYIFDQVASNTQTGFNGIVVDSGCNSVTIKNGILRSFKGAAIVISQNCSEIIVSDITISDCQDSGIQVTDSSEIAIRSCAISDIQAVTQSNAVGIRLTNCVKTTICACALDGFDGPRQNEMVGIYCTNLTSIDIADTQAIQQNGRQFAAGFFFQSCTDGILTNCMAYNSTTEGDGSDIAAGFYYDSCQRFWLRGCQSVAHVSTTGFSYGFYARRSARTTYDASYAQLNVGLKETAGIFLDREERSYITNCTIRGNQSLSDSAYGIRIANADLCYVQNNTIVNTSGGRSFGIIDETNPSTSLIIGNYAFNNDRNYTVQYAGGVSLAIIDGSLSNSSPGMPSGIAGAFDNMSVMP